MTKLGYCLTAELHGPNEMVEHARRAEQAGFRFALISDHYHPWTSDQGHSPFVWGVIGGIAQAPDAQPPGTGVFGAAGPVHLPGVVPAAATARRPVGGGLILRCGAGG